MIFLWILIGIVVLMGLVALVNWWRDEREKQGIAREFITSPATPQHPSIDPYLVDLRAFLLTPPLPQGPGEMAERVYLHLTDWLNHNFISVDAAAQNFEDELLTGPVSRFQDISRNDPPPIDGEQ